MSRTLPFLVLLMTGAATCAAAQAPGPAPAVAPLSQPLRGATLTVQEVTLSRPQEAIVEGARRSVRSLVEFRVAAADPIPARALDPVLVVGTTRVTDYRYENGDRALVFTLYDASKLAAEAATADAYLQFGDDETTRTPLPQYRRAEMRRVKR
jgi:hypothetical protein